MLSARELEPALLPPNAQTWVNRHVLFTHGNGVVMSPVTRKSAEGLPIFYRQDIPPVASGGPAVSEPRIYFGQGADTYVIVKGSTPEFDYPKGKDNVYAAYDGADGVAVGGTARRTLFAWYLNSPNILLSSYITDGSRILFRRDIRDRVRTIAPFLRLDNDPYVVISDGRLFWMQDAYTTSRWFPYAQPLPDGGTNYIRNSVKVVIDAYNGSVNFYVADPSDAIAATYQRIIQNTDISQQVSLWNQMGSRVIRGNLLVVPIENSILYVSPLYLRAETGQLPELKRVIAAYGDHVVMEETLAGALAALFQESAPASLLPLAPAGTALGGPADARAREALSHYDRAIERLKAGDWAGFGAELDALRPLLEELSQHLDGR